MQNLMINICYTFLAITVLTAGVTLAGLTCVWFSPETCPNPAYLNILLVGVVIEIASIVFFIVKKGLSYLPEVVTNKTPEETKQFLEKFISSGSSATIYSSRVSWLIGNERLLKILSEKISKGLRVEIVTAQEIDPSIKKNLPNAKFYLSNEKNPPDARFTLINGDRNGAERLAIAKGSHPNHEITIFDTNSGPQIIGMAKDLIRKSKGLHNG
jgi:hypothetical protein